MLVLIKDVKQTTHEWKTNLLNLAVVYASISHSEYPYWGKEF